LKNKEKQRAFGAAERRRKGKKRVQNERRSGGRMKRMG
jgi:hypothetical protein